MNSKHPLLSIIVTSYTMERFEDICDLFDSIKKRESGDVPEGKEGKQLQKVACPLF